MNSKQRVKAIMEGGATDRPPVFLYIAWPEYAWRVTGHPVWEAVLGSIDGVAATNKILQRHHTDVVFGPISTLGSGFLAGKMVEHQDQHTIVFQCQQTGRRWSFALEGHVLTEIDQHGNLLDHGHMPGQTVTDPPATVAEAEAWALQKFQSLSAAPGHPYNQDPAVQQWGQQYFMMTEVPGPFVSVVYEFGFESALMLLASEPQVFVRLAELYLEFYQPHFQWAASAGYDCGQIVESYLSAEVISPVSYQNWVAPLHQTAARMIQSYGLKASFYNPGQSQPFLLQFKQQGWDVIHLDDLCQGQEVDIAQARQLLGAEQCLFGNMSAYSLLRGDWDEIADRVRYQHTTAAQLGPFIISNGSAICDQTDPEIVDRWLDYAMHL